MSCIVFVKYERCLLCLPFGVNLFVFKQKTAYEMRISDWSSDVCSSDLFVTRPRFSTLTYSGPQKLTRLPPRSAVVAFSAAEVYATAELIRRQRGGTAV